MHRDQFVEANPDEVFHGLLHLDWSKVNLALPMRIVEVAARDVSGLRLKANIATGRHGTWSCAPFASGRHRIRQEINRIGLTRQRSARKNWTLHSFSPMCD